MVDVLVYLILFQYEVGYRAKHAGNGIYFFLKDQWDLIAQGVSDDPTKGCCDHSKGNADDGMKTILQSYFCSYDSEYAKPNGIKKKHGLTQIPYFFAKNNGENHSDDNCIDIIDMGHPGDAVGIDQDVSEGSASHVCHKSDDEDPEGVHSFFYGKQGPGDGETRRSQEVQKIEYAHGIV